MLKQNEPFKTSGARRRILVVDDELINREMLSICLQDSYEILQAGDGAQAMEILNSRGEEISLVLLDILMPVMSGMEVLAEMRGDPVLSRIPVIVLTADSDAEVECLKMGAADFIPKPYPAPAVVQARVLRTIELSEDRETIQSTERDQLTGLYNREFFFRYAKQLDQLHRGEEMDAVLIDVDHFHLINERYGRVYGDEVLRRIGENARAVFSPAGGIVCRREADTFLVYCPHREDYKEVLEQISAQISGQEEADNRVRLRMGVYPCVDKTLDPERRFDRAKRAADLVQGSFTRSIAYYDNELISRELYAEQLIEDFYTAIRENQFLVYYQPKYDVRPDEPMLAGAEALVRWNHPKLGMISPGVFIPLFEGNGLIRELDQYVWREACRHIRDWKNRLGFSVPTSVNVSRIDLYDPNLMNDLDGLIREFGLEHTDLSLEITESAYTQDSGQITAAVENLRGLGFRIEMDDFGTGYSSLNMVSSLPFDILKLDMQFIRSAFAEENGDTKMLELIIDIADYLAVPVIAEGVETEDQMKALKIMGCDLVQGYYFSRPVPEPDFEPFLLKQKEESERIRREEKEKAAAELIRAEEMRRAGIEAAEKEQAGKTGTGGEEAGTAFGTPEPFRPQNPQADQHETGEEKPGIYLRSAGWFFALIATVAAIVLFGAGLQLMHGYQRMEAASDDYIAARIAASEMESASDYLTDRVRCYIVTGEKQYLDDFLEEIHVSRRRDQAVEELENLLGGRDRGAIDNLNTALGLSNELLETEFYAFRLKAEAGSADVSGLPEEIRAVQLLPEDQELTAEEKNDKAQSLVFDSRYMDHKTRIRDNVNKCTEALIQISSQELEQASAGLSRLVIMQLVLTIVFLVIVLGLVAFINNLVRKPLSAMVGKMQAGEPIPPQGAEELRFVARTYNSVLQENREAHEKLRHEASHDALTGLFNRGAYDLMMESVDAEHIALIILDVDYFKQFNDTYGHAVGDRVLQRVADILRHSFRSVDVLCRIGGDEFAVIMTRVNSSMSQLVMNKIKKAAELLANPKDDLPPVTLSVGIAFADRENPQGDIFKDADTALYRVKEAGRNGCQIY